MKIIFAQGNPGRQYARTRHNTGFFVVDALADEFEGSWRTQEKFKIESAEISLENEKVLLVKPLSFYNDTGLVARALLDFYKLNPAQDLLVVHDDLALPLGTIRVRQKGSDAGNNGIKSLNAHLDPEYARIRIGIWNETRDQMDDAAFVLSAFTAAELKQLTQIIEGKALPLVRQFIRGELEPSSHTL